MFVDGSSRQNPDGTNATGFDVVTETWVLLKRPLPKKYSAQTAELAVLTETCKLGNGKVVNICVNVRVFKAMEKQVWQHPQVNGNGPFIGMMEKSFGRWSELVTSVLLFLYVVAAILVTRGGCCIPCLRGLFKRLIETTLTRTMYRQVETDDDNELHMDDGDEDADDVFKCKAVPYITLSEFSMKWNVYWKCLWSFEQWCTRYTRLCKEC